MWRLRKILFSKKWTDKDHPECWVATIPACLGCLSVYVRSIVEFLIQYPHLPLYNLAQSPKSYAMPESYTPNVSCHAVLYNTKARRTSDKIWCIKKLEILFNFYFFWINIHDEFDEHWNCAGYGFNKVGIFTFQFSLSDIHISFANINMNLHSKKLIIFKFKFKFK